MNDVVKYDIDELLEREYKRISMGITPSNRVHFGFAFIMVYPFLYMKEHLDATLEVVVTDRDLDPQMGRVFRPFNLREDPQNCHNLFREHVVVELGTMCEEYTQFFDIDPSRVVLYYFTQYLTQEPEFFEAFKQLLLDQEKARALKKAIFDRGKAPYNVPFSPICPSCGYSNAHLGNVDYGHRMLKSTCFKPGCEQEGKKVSVSIDDPKGYNVHYMTTPVRDLFELRGSPRADLHIFGGDFDRKHGVKKVPKVERVRNIMRIFDQEIPDIFISQLIAWEGEKVSKSGRRFWPYFGWNPEERRGFLERAVECVTKSYRGHPIIDHCR